MGLRSEQRNIRLIFGAGFLLGSVGAVVNWFRHEGHIRSILDGNLLLAFMLDEKQNILILITLMLVSQIVLFELKFWTRKSLKKIASNIGMLGFVFSFLAFCWFGLPDDYLHWNFFVKLPLWAISFVLFTVSFLEAMHAIDELAGLDDDMKDSWSSEVNTEELRWLMESLKKRKFPTYLLCGDIHTGGFSNIKAGDISVPQITSSPITYPTMPPIVEKLTTGAKKIALPQRNPEGTAENVFFLSERNFALVTTGQQETWVEFVFEGHDKNIQLRC